MRQPSSQNGVLTEVEQLSRLRLGRPDVAPHARSEPAQRVERVLAIVLFTDIVGSVAMAWRLGDRRWRDLLERHDRLVRQELARCHGREIDSAGDGFFAAFDRPGDAIDCACAIRKHVRDIGLDVRAGLHAGELEPLGSKLVGIAASLGARIASVAAAGEILVSSTVRDLVLGTGIPVRDRGLHVLRGIPGRRRLFAIEDGV